ncbi:hypothetical protein [Gordonia alkanivorans]|uniref:hypothetical protein n=2 Tax=Gordonia alkanivorans TaxID=84096 RepID=UPI0012F4E23F|nr:hypothetical protein [Gordonia alkanivorans]MDH3026374.1 hypothetical protein [Gordonia alkanivorans]
MVRVKRTPEGGLCRRCYNARRHEMCGSCGKQKVPSTRTATGEPLCVHCARPKRRCAGCGRIDHIKATSDVGELCQRCYNAPQRRCGQCGTDAPIAIRAHAGTTDLCHRCASTPEKVCGICMQSHPVHTHWPLGPVCQRCYRAAVNHPRRCAQCSTDRALIGKNSAADPICGPCAGSKVGYECRVCGKGGPHHFAQTCHRCSIIRLTRELLTGPHGSSVPAGLEPLPDYLADRGQPQSTLRWLSKPTTSALLGSLALIDEPLSHSALDQCPPSWGRHHLREVLIDAELLPARDEPIERLGTWITETAAALPAHQSALIGPYGHWAILRRARRRSRRRRFTHAAADAARNRIRTAITLLDHLDENEWTISDLTQSKLDAWTDGQRRRTNNIAGFIGWLTQRGLAQNLSITRYTYPPPSQTGDEHDHHRTIAALLSGDTPADLPTRVAGLLVLLYGARLSQLQNLTTSSLKRRKTRRYITLARHPIELPDRLADLIDVLARQATNNPNAYTRDGRGHYLLPGSRAHHPLHPTTLSRKLTAAGVPSRISRNHALLALGTDLPAAVLATQLGLSTATTTGWAKLAQRDYTAYLHSRE